MIPQLKEWTNVFQSVCFISLALCVNGFGRDVFERSVAAGVGVVATDANARDNLAMVPGAQLDRGDRQVI